MGHDKRRQTNYELELLDDIILKYLNSACSTTLTNEKLEQWQNIAQTQREIIKKKIICGAFSLEKEKKIRCYIHNHQSRICYLIDNLINLYYNNSHSKEEFFKTIEVVYEVLLDIRIFLSQQFSEYFNFDEKADIPVKVDKFYCFEEKIDNVKVQLNSQKSRLLNLALEPILEFMNGRNDYQISFRSLIYYETLLNEMETLVMPEKSFDDGLKFMLIGINFNSLNFLGYLIQEIENDLKKEHSHSDKVSKLSWYLKNYNQIIEKNDLVLKPKQTSIKIQINQWIIEEINYLEKNLQISRSISGISQPDFKIQTELSVSQLGYFFKLLFDTGVIKNQNQTEAIRFISNHMSSRQVETISAESLRSKFYRVEEGTKASIKEIMIRILNEINKPN